MPATFTFDGINKVIECDNTSSFSAVEIYSRWKDWVLSADNSKYQQAFRYVGGDPTVGGKSLGITYFLTNNWKIQPFSQDHRLQIEGNLYTDGGDSPFIPSSGSFNVTIETEVSSINTSEAVISVQQQILEYESKLLLDTSLGISGSTYPAGTKTSPSNNIGDAITLANNLNLSTILISSDITIGSNLDISNLTLIGMNKSYTITLDGCTANNTQFKNLTLTGTLPQ